MEQNKATKKNKIHGIVDDAWMPGWFFSAGIAGASAVVVFGLQMLGGSL